MLEWFGRRQGDGTWFTCAAERNKGPILDVLAKRLPEQGVVLEIASGTGQHVVHFARALPHLTWQPSDPQPELRAANRSRIDDERLTNVQPPLDLDVACVPWPIASADAMICINMIHVAPWSATNALFRGASTIVAPGRILYLYGPYRRFGGHTSESNAQFDASLRARDPAWGVRDVEAITEVALAVGFALEALVDMPANNFSLVFRRQG